MAKYIDADALIPDLYSRRREIPHQIDGNTDWYLQGFNVGIVHAVIAVENAPTIYPDEVRVVGHWVTEQEAIDANDYSLRDTCSVCGQCDWDCTESASFKYCPNCGARMEVSEDA